MMDLVIVNIVNCPSKIGGYSSPQVNLPSISLGSQNDLLNRKQCRKYLYHLIPTHVLMGPGWLHDGGIITMSTS